MLGLARGSFLFFSRARIRCTASGALCPAPSQLGEDAVGTLPRKGTVKAMKGSKNGGWRIYLTGLLVEAITLVLSSLVAAALAYASSDSTRVVGMYSLASLIISAAIGGVLTARLAGEGGVRIVALASLTVVMVMLLCAVIVGGGSPRLSALMNYICYLGVSVGAAHLARPRKKRHKRR